MPVFFWIKNWIESFSSEIQSLIESSNCTSQGYFSQDFILKDFFSSFFVPFWTKMKWQGLREYREQINSQTSFLDLDNVYGYNTDRSEKVLIHQFFAKVRLSYCFTVWLALGSWLIGCSSPCQKYLLNPYNAIFLKSQWSKDIKNAILNLTPAPFVKLCHKIDFLPW